MPEPDPVAAWLAEAGQRLAAASPERGFGTEDMDWQPYVRRLLAAVEKALKFHQPGPFALLGALCPEHEACRHFSITSNEADRVAACPNCSAAVQCTCTHGGGAFWPCAEYLAVSRELLTGKESD